MGPIAFFIKKRPKSASRFFQLWEKFTYSATTNFPRTTGLLASNLYVILSIPNRLRDRSSLYPDYISHSLARFPGDHLRECPLNDKATNFFLRLILEQTYQTVVEIGTFYGERIVSLKRIVPSINAFGLDIGPDFATPFIYNGVQFMQFNDNFFSNLPEKSLIVANGTLTCMTIEEVKKLLSLIFITKQDIAISEPSAFFEPYGIESPRRNAVSYYHGYNRLAIEAGLAPLLSYTKATSYNYQPDHCEGIYYNLLSSNTLNRCNFTSST